MGAPLKLPPLASSARARSGNQFFFVLAHLQLVAIVTFLLTCLVAGPIPMEQCSTTIRARTIFCTTNIFVSRAIMDLCRAILAMHTMSLAKPATHESVRRLELSPTGTTCAGDFEQYATCDTED